MSKKNYQQLSQSERHAIALGLQQKQGSLPFRVERYSSNKSLDTR